MTSPEGTAADATPDATPDAGASAPAEGSLADEAQAAAEAAEVADTTDTADTEVEEAGHGRHETPEAQALRSELEERTRDLQRVQAEFVNYKRRVERDRELVKQNAGYAVLAPIIEVLDNVDRARESAVHQGQELDGGLKAVAEQLERVVANLGLLKFGAPGEPFDPARHEALSSMGPDPDGVAEVSTIKLVAKAGYTIGDRVVRAAQVITVEPA